MCTSFRLTAADEAVIIGRTMEFPDLLGAQIAIVPRGNEGASTGPDGAGVQWTGAYGYVGVDGFGDVHQVTDGLNDAGLYAGLQYMPGFADYESPDGVDADQLLAPEDVAAYLLASCGSVQELITTLGSVTVWPAVYPAFGFPPPVHVIAHDRTGAAAVIEWIKGEQVVFDNPNGVATNWPHMDWHLTNVRNYLGLSPTNVEARDIAGQQLAPMGQGTGMLGLPGDPSSPSRFVRASVLVASLRQPTDAAEAQLAAQHILNALDIPKGLIREDADDAHDDHTLWSSIADVTNGTYAIRTYTDPTWRQIAFADIDLSGGAARQMPLPDAAGFLSLDT